MFAKIFNITINVDKFSNTKIPKEWNLREINQIITNNAEMSISFINFDPRDSPLHESGDVNHLNWCWNADRLQKGASLKWLCHDQGQLRFGFESQFPHELAITKTFRTQRSDWRRDANWSQWPTPEKCSFTDLFQLRPRFKYQWLHRCASTKAVTADDFHWWWNTNRP
jgi:hypothetical protein